MITVIKIPYFAMILDPLECDSTSNQIDQIFRILSQLFDMRNAVN